MPTARRTRNSSDAIAKKPMKTLMRLSPRNSGVTMSANSEPNPPIVAKSTPTIDSVPIAATRGNRVRRLVSAMPSAARKPKLPSRPSDAVAFSFTSGVCALYERVNALIQPKRCMFDGSRSCTMRRP